MKRMFVIGMLMFTVLVCSCGPSQEEFDELKQQKERLSEEVEELNNIVRFVDGDVTRITKPALSPNWKTIWYLDGNYEIYETHKNVTQCYYDATINLPYPLSCQLPPKGTRNPKQRTMEEAGYGKTREEQKLD